MLINDRNFYFLFYGYYIADIPAAVWVHYDYLHCTHPHTATQRIRLDLPQMILRIVSLRRGTSRVRARSMVSWKGACGKHIEESIKVEDVLAWGEGVCEEKPLRLVIGKCSQPPSQGPFLKWKPSRPVRAVIGSNAGPQRWQLEWTVDISYYLPCESYSLPFLRTYRITEDRTLVYSVVRKCTIFFLLTAE